MSSPALLISVNTRVTGQTGHRERRDVVAPERRRRPMPTHDQVLHMKNLSIAAKLWLPVVALIVVVLLMTTASLVHTRSLQGQSRLDQEQQQTKFELALRWRG